MGKIKVVVEGQEYQISKPSENELFTVEHSGGISYLAYSVISKSWKYDTSRKKIDLPVDIDLIGKEIEEHFYIE